MALAIAQVPVMMVPIHVNSFLFLIFASCNTPYDTSDKSEGLSPPTDFVFTNSFTVENDAGIWIRDDEFSLPDVSVPMIFIKPDGTYGMLVSAMNLSEGRWPFYSENGLDWLKGDSAVITPKSFDIDCGNKLEDGTILYQEDGSYILLVEATYSQSENSEPIWRRWCQAKSSDGEQFTPINEYFFTGFENDGEQISVPSALPIDNWRQIIYYVGDLNTQASTHSGIRSLIVEEDGSITQLTEQSLMESDKVDPNPAYLAGSGLRLFHTRGLSGGAGKVDSLDGITLSDPVQLISNSTDCMKELGGECLLDPAYLRLPDGQPVIYFTQIIFEEDDYGFPLLHFSIQRAFFQQSK